MKQLAAGLFLALAACSGDKVNQDQMATMEQRLRAKALEDQQALRNEIAKLRDDMKNLDVMVKKFELTAQQIQKSDVLDKVDAANKNVIKSLEIQEQYLKQLLESIRALIEELKKK